jgi:hypothetical protein
VAAAPQDPNSIPEYNPDGTYRHNGRKEPYTPFGSNVGEGEQAKMMFATVELPKLKRNFAFLTNQDPLFPNIRRVSLLDLHGDKTNKIRVNPNFWDFVVKEYEIHQSSRITRGEERSNGFKKKGSRNWQETDHDSLLVNNERLPPKRDFYKPALGSN